MKILLFSRPQVAHTPEALRRLFEAARERGFEIAVNEEFAPIAEQAAGIALPESARYGARIAPTPPDQAVMVCYGGDGTLLEGVHRLGGAPVPVAGIHAGHLGFLTGTAALSAREAVDALMERIAAGKLVVEPRSMLDVSGPLPEGVRLALNEFTVQRHGAGLISVETSVDGQAVATYHGDGAILSTPTGSTAYSLSAGGPVVAPTCACLILSPLAPHNLTMRPIVIPDSAVVTMRIRSRHAGCFVTLDNRTYPADEGAVFTIRRAEERILLAVPHNISFYDTLRNKMMWGIDIRS